MTTKATDRVFIDHVPVPLMFKQIEANKLDYSGSAVRKTAVAEDDNGRWIVWVNYGVVDDGCIRDEDGYVTNDHATKDSDDIVGIFSGSEEDATEVARLVRESATK